MEEGVSDLITNLKEILSNVKANSNRDDVVKKPGKYLGPAIKIYADFLKQNNSSCFAEFEKKVKHEGRNNESLQSVIEKLWELEEQWDDFLKDFIGKSQVLEFKVQKTIYYNDIIINCHILI